MKKDAGAKVKTATGYVIIPPESNRFYDVPSNALYATLADTPTQAWSRMISGRFCDYDADPDFSRKVQAYYDRGYRLKKIAVILNNEDIPDY